GRRPPPARPGDPRRRGPAAARGRRDRPVRARPCVVPPGPRVHAWRPRRGVARGGLLPRRRLGHGERRYARRLLPPAPPRGARPRRPRGRAPPAPAPPPPPPA